MTLNEAAHEAITMIAAAYDAPSMGYEGTSDFESICVAKVAKRTGFSEAAIQQEMFDIEHANDGPYGVIN